LLLFHDGKRIGYEFKYAENPSVTRSMRIAIEDLKLAALKIICPGNVHAKLDEKIEVVGLSSLVP
jgi:hypothetical protein